MFWGCSGDVLGMFWGCSGDVWEVFGRCLEGVWDVLGMVGRCLGVVECCLEYAFDSFGSFRDCFGDRGGWDH